MAPMTNHHDSTLYAFLSEVVRLCSLYSLIGKTLLLIEVQFRDRT